MILGLKHVYVCVWWSYASCLGSLFRGANQFLPWPPLFSNKSTTKKKRIAALCANRAAHLTAAICATSEGNEQVRGSFFFVFFNPQPSSLCHTQPVICKAGHQIFVVVFFLHQLAFFVLLLCGHLPRHLSLSLSLSVCLCSVCALPPLTLDVAVALSQ